MSTHALIFPLVHAIEAAGYKAYNVTSDGSTRLVVDIDGQTVTLAVTEVIDTPDKRSACDKVLDEAIESGKVLAEDKNIVAQGMQRALNMAHDAGRPSDAMRSAVWEYAKVGRDEFIRRMNVKVA
jgi:propanediol dehydratase small subunit